MFGLALIPSLALVALVGWSRVRLGDHTIGQVVAGALVGVLIAMPTFLLLY
ncbi:phosphatase PAP2 family protein [Micromonospora sp. NPDC049497]|uniref:phosphatase PAP2 family protein n=1 Tax=Micromonospora sp. NPDC049497 TaxID=3364273 RepID=UPI0037A6AE35